MANYIKDSKGLVRATTTTNLELEKPLTNDNYDIGVHNRNMDKLDVAINNVKNEVSSMEFVSTKVIRPNKQTVEQSLVANENSIGNHSSRISSNETSISNIRDEMEGVVVRAKQNLKNIIDML